MRPDKPYQIIAPLGAFFFSEYHQQALSDFKSRLDKPYQIIALSRGFFLFRSNKKNLIERGAQSHH